MRWAETIGNNVRRLRLLQKLTQEELAAEAHISMRHIGRLERGEGNPTVDVLERIASVLGARAKDLLEDQPLPQLRHRRIVAKVLIPGFDRAVQLDRQRLAMAVAALARLDADPAFGNAVFLDVVAHHALEPDADAALQLLRIEMGAARVDRQVIGRDVGAGSLFFAHASASRRCSALVNSSALA